jgi:hypothetical protein
VPTNPVGGWPAAGNTGPIGTLTAYTGPCNITTPGTLIASRVLDCNVNVNAANVTIANSRITGEVEIFGSGFQLLDSLVEGNQGACSVCSTGSPAFTVARSEIVGGNRGVWCRNCTLRDSWLHGNVFNAGDHGSAARADQYSTMIHNTLQCEGSPCSADLTGYPDFQPTHHWTIDGNLFVGSDGISFCAYAGGTTGKPYSDHPDNATFIVFRNNTFGRGPSGKCGLYGHVSAFIPTNNGNVWSDNVWDNGGEVPPD